MSAATARVAGPLAAAALAACAGCTSAPGGPHDAPAPMRDAGAFEILASRAPSAADALRADDIEPLAAGSVRWLTTDGGPPFEVSTEEVPPRFERRDPVATRTLARTADGGVALERQRDASDGAVLVFTGPLVLAPARLAPGDEPTSTSGVITERGQARDNDGGRAQRSLRIASVDRVRTPLGEFDAVRVDAALTMKVPLASLRRETSTWVRPGTGPVAVRSDEQVLVMGIVPRNRSETRVRLSATGGAR